MNHCMITKKCPGFPGHEGSAAAAPAVTASAAAAAATAVVTQQEHSRDEKQDPPPVAAICENTASVITGITSHLIDLLNVLKRCRSTHAMPPGKNGAKKLEKDIDYGNNF